MTDILESTRLARYYVTAVRNIHPISFSILDVSSAFHEGNKIQKNP